MPPTLTFFTPPKLYIPILVISSVLKWCIREMMLASAFLLFQTMWFWSWCKDDIFTDLRTLFIITIFHILVDWLVEDQNQFVTIALFPLWRFLCLLIDFMQAVKCGQRVQTCDTGLQIQNIDCHFCLQNVKQRKGSTGESQNKSRLCLP